MTGRHSPRSGTPPREERTGERQARDRRGRMSEFVAAALLMAKGWRILAHRFKSSAGEIDLVAARRNRLAFIEVKQRATFADCEASISDSQRRRIRRAADLWLAKHPRHQRHDISFDVVFLVPRRMPRHIENGL